MAEDALEKDDRDHIAIWLLDMDLPEKLNWPSTFVALFDRVFTEKHLSWRCFRRSSVASVAAVVVITLAVAAVDPSMLDDLFKIAGDSPWSMVVALLALVFMTLVFNLLPDYLSLYETRLVLGVMAKSGGWMRTLALLVFDLAATMLITFVVGFVLMLSLLRLLLGNPVTVAWVVKLFWQNLSFSSHDPHIGIFIYSALFTSVWVWLYALSGVLVRSVATSRKGLHFLQRRLNLEEHPLRSMGFVLVLLVTAVYLVWGAALVV